MTMATDLEKAFKALNDKREGYSRFFAYYDGDQPVQYTAKRLEEIFKGLDAVFTENWCAVVIDSVKDRINLTGIETPEIASETWARLWETSEIKLESDEAHEAALVTGEAFIVAWPDENGIVQAFYNDPRLCHVFYEEGNPRVKRMAAKWYVDADDNTRMTLYYPDRLEYYRATSKTPSSANAFTADQESEINPYGEVPVFHLRLAKRTTKSDLKSVIPVQNGINKLLADMMVAAEYGAFKQRYIISNADNLGKLKNAPNENWLLPAGDGMGQQTQVGQLDATALKNYLDGIDNLSMGISSITRTPKHYFFSIGSNLSGEALIAMEAPLNKKAQDRIDRFAPVWKDICRFMLKVSGVEVDPQAIRPVFDTPETIQPFTEAQTMQMYVSLGAPIRTAARWVGRTEAEIAQMELDIREAEASQQASLAQGLLEAQRRFDSGDQRIGQRISGAD